MLTKTARCFGRESIDTFQREYSKWFSRENCLADELIGSRLPLIPQHFQENAQLALSLGMHQGLFAGFLKMEIGVGSLILLAVVDFAGGDAINHHFR